MKTTTPAKAPKKIYNYQTKASSLQKRGIFFIVFFLVIIGAIIGVLSYQKIANNSKTLKISNLRTEINNIKERSRDIQSQVADAKRFNQIWLDTDPKKKSFEDVKVSELSDKFTEIAQKYNLSKPTITISVPELLKQPPYQDLRAIDVNLITFSIAFTAITDLDAINYAKEITNSLPGYVVISNFSITKNKKEGYTSQDFIDISNKKEVGMVSTTLNFVWYYLKYKAKP